MSNKVRGIIIVREKTEHAPKMHKINGFVLFILKAAFVFFSVSIVVFFLTWTLIAHRLITYSSMQMQNDSLILHARQIDSLKVNIMGINNYLEYFKVVSSLDNRTAPPTFDEYLKNAALIASFEIPDAQREFRKIPKIRPVTGVISRGFDKAAGHEAVDFVAPLGTPIRSAADGEVKNVYFAEDLGRVVVIRHSEGYQTLYAHCHEIFVKAGQSVTQGETIALVGSSGSRSRGPHLHYEITQNGKAIDPEKLFF